MWLTQHSSLREWKECHKVIHICGIWPLNYFFCETCQNLSTLRTSWDTQQLLCSQKDGFLSCSRSSSIKLHGQFIGSQNSSNQTNHDDFCHYHLFRWTTSFLMSMSPPSLSWLLNKLMIYGCRQEWCLSINCAPAQEFSNLVNSEIICDTGFHQVDNIVHFILRNYAKSCTNPVMLYLH